MEQYAIAYGLLAIIVFILKNDIEDKHFFPLEFILITLSGMFAYDWKVDWNIWDIFSSLGGSTALALAFLALLGYLEYIRNEDEIEVFFNYTKNDKKNKIPTGLKVLRKNCTRAEIQGLLRILSAGKMFNMKSVLKEKKILNLVDEIQTGKDKKLIIDIEEKEIEQFVNLPYYEKVFKKYNIQKEKEKEKAFFNIKTQKQIDKIEKLLEELKDKE